MSSIAIIGQGAHARVISDIIRQGPYPFDSLRLVQWPCSLEDYTTRIVGIGDNATRLRVVEGIEVGNRTYAYRNCKYLTAIHASAVIGLGATVGRGAAIMPGAIVGTGCKIGEHCILNTNSSLDHDSVMGDFSSLAPGVTSGGDVTIGEGSAICVGATISHGITIGANTVIGAGSTVLEDIGPNVVAYGTPARVQRTRKLGDKYL